MELKNYNIKTLLLVDLIDAKYEYFVNKYFINAYSFCKSEDSIGKIFLAYDASYFDAICKIIKEIKNNKYYYNWFPKNINGKKCIVFSFKVSKNEIDNLEFYKKYNRNLEYFVEVKKLCEIFKDNINDIYTYFINGITNDKDII